MRARRPVLRTAEAVFLALCVWLWQGQTATWAVSGNSLAEELQHRLAAQTVRVGPHRLEAAGLREFYAGGGFAPLWRDGEGGPGRAERLLEVLRRAAEQGLRPDDYAIAAIAARLATSDPGPRAELDLMLTHELLHYARDLRSGRTAPRAADPELYVSPPKIDRRAVLDGALSSSDLRRFLAGLAPSNGNYRALRRVLADYRAIAARGGWPVLRRGGTLAEGLKGARVGRLRRRLELSGDMRTSGEMRRTFDAELADGVMRFQLRHGLEDDGVVGPATRAALDVPVEARIQQILVNLERWRWMPDHLGARYILVNMAGYRLEVVEGGWPVLDMRVVIGRPYRRTPVFSGRMTYLEFNPSWTLPRSIATQDYLPRLRRDPGILDKQSIRVFDGWRKGARELNPAEVDWSRVSAERFPYMLRQDPGPKNALGRVKFMFPNPFKVYLHDTPAGELFSRRVRTFSSGCIRVARPWELATYLLKDEAGWSSDRIDDVIGSDRTRRVGLSVPVPVYLTYSTVWSGQDGAANFRADIYGRDALLGRALFGRAYKASGQTPVL